jgi:hypothetical protein
MCGREDVILIACNVRNLFEDILRRCMAAGLAEGRSFSVDGTFVEANAGHRSRVPRPAARAERSPIVPALELSGHLAQIS